MCIIPQALLYKATDELPLTTKDQANCPLPWTHSRVCRARSLLTPLTGFVDFIRHGKHARAGQATHDTSSTQPQPADTSSSPSRKEAEQRRQERAERERNEKVKAIKDKAHHTQAAEAIVQEERAANSKMPTIKGLERFRLLDKMGE